MPLIPAKIQALVEWWGRIDNTVTRALHDIGEKLTAKSALEFIHPFGSAIGCGEFGCVYPTRTPNGRWVVKMSLDPFEGPLTNFVIRDPKLKLHPGVAYFINIWQLPVGQKFNVLSENSQWKTVEYPIWLILREDIDPTEDVPDKLMKTLNQVRNWAEVVNLTIDDIQENEAQEHELMPYFESFMENVDTVGNMKKAGPVSDFIEKFWNQTGVALADVHGGNIGYRFHNTKKFGGHDQPENKLSDYYVCFDVGASKFKAGKAPIQLLKNPGKISVIR